MFKGAVYAASFLFMGVATRHARIITMLRKWSQKKRDRQFVQHGNKLVFYPFGKFAKGYVVPEGKEAWLRERAYQTTMLSVFVLACITALSYLFRPALDYVFLAACIAYLAFVWFGLFAIVLKWKRYR